MAYNKVVVDGTTKLDLTSDTVNVDSLLYGKTAHNAAGEKITGIVVLQMFYTGTSEPSNSLGSDGDLYFVTEA